MGKLVAEPTSEAAAADADDLAPVAWHSARNCYHDNMYFKAILVNLAHHPKLQPKQ